MFAVRDINVDPFFLLATFLCMRSSYFIFLPNNKNKICSEACYTYAKLASLHVFSVQLLLNCENIFY